MTDTTTAPSPPPMPETERAGEITEQSQAIGEFLDWLGSEEGGGLFVARWERMIECGNVFRRGNWTDIAKCRSGRMIATDEHPTHDEGVDMGECQTCDGTGLVERNEPVAYHNPESITTLLARYFKIDHAKVDREQRDLLAWMREQG